MITQVMLSVGVEKWTGSAYCRNSKESIYENHNLCVGCRLQYPKEVSRCMDSSCGKPLRTRAKKKKSQHYGDQDEK